MIPGTPHRHAALRPPSLPSGFLGVVFRFPEIVRFMLCAHGRGRLFAFLVVVYFLPLVVVVRAPANILYVFPRTTVTGCTSMLCASRNFPLPLSHSMLAPGLRSSTLFSLFPSFSVRSFPCFCTSQSLYFLRIRFPSVDFLYNSYALFVCLCLLVIAMVATCLPNVSLVCVREVETS